MVPCTRDCSVVHHRKVQTVAASTRRAIGCRLPLASHHPPTPSAKNSRSFRLRQREICTPRRCLSLRLSLRSPCGAQSFFPCRWQPLASSMHRAPMSSPSPNSPPAICACVPLHMRPKRSISRTVTVTGGPRCLRLGLRSRTLPLPASPRRGQRGSVADSGVREWHSSCRLGFVRRRNA